MKTGKNRPEIITLVLLPASVSAISQSFADTGSQWNMVTSQKIILTGR